MQNKKIKLLIVATHPIQYQIPWFRELAKQADIDLTVYFGMIPDQKQQGVGFGVAFSWDIPLLEGYQWELLENQSKNPSLSSFFGCNTPGIKIKLASARPDLVISTGWQSLMLLQTSKACKSLGIPCLIRAESNALKPRNWIKRLIQKRIIRQFSAYLAIGKANKQLYLEYGVPEDKIFDCPYFIDNERFKNSVFNDAKEEMELKTNLKLDDQKFTFIFSGKLIEKKRPLDLIRAFGNLKKSYPSAHLIIVGTGELYEQAVALSDSLHADVSFAGFINQSLIPMLYKLANCIVLPSDYDETWGLVVNEAMACGLPAIVSDHVGCAQDLVKEGVTGWVFPFSNVEQLTAKMALAISDSSHARQMGQNAQAKVLEHYAVDTVVTGTMNAIRSVLST